MGMTKQQLATKIWGTANALRSKIKANEYKDYIIGFLFYKYLSDAEESYLKKESCSKEDLKEFDQDSINLVKDSLGYYISYDDLFSTWNEKEQKLGAADVSKSLERFNKNVKDTYRKVFENIFSTLEGGLSKLGDSSGSRDKAVRDIVELIDDIPTTESTYDVLGYIYEYLIYKFSTAAKDDGSFYTPHEVSSLIARIVAYDQKDKPELTVYDPTSGSGSLLLNIGSEAGKYIDCNNIKYYGQEKITETYHLTRMNLIMKGVNVMNLFVRNADTLEDDWPYFDEVTDYEPLRVDIVVSNPPYSQSYESGNLANDPRFKYGLAPEGKADYAFLLHCLYHLQPDGIMAIVLPHGVLFRGEAEEAIRKNLIENNHIETIIGLPDNLFYATGISTIIMILKKERSNSDVLFVDASQSYTKDGAQNVLRERDVKKIFDVVVKRNRRTDISRLVEKEELVNNGYNLNISRYISAEAETETYDFSSVMTGKIKCDELYKFESFWNKFASLQQEILSRDEKHKDYYSFKDVNIRDTIHNNIDVIAFRDAFTSISGEFKSFLIENLVEKYNLTSKETVNEVVEKLFEIYKKEPLVDTYDVYQAMHECWDEIETDLITIRKKGLDICKEIEPNIIVKKNNKTKKMEEEQDGEKGVIIPLDLIKEKYFKTDFEKANSIQMDAEAQKDIWQDIFDTLENEIKKQVQNKKENGFDSKKLATAIKLNSEYKEELEAAENAIKQEKKLCKESNKIISNLDVKAKDKIKALSQNEINELLVEKWIEPMISKINKIGFNTVNTFTEELINLKTKYGNPLSSIDTNISDTELNILALLDELIGSETDLEAISLLKNVMEDNH